MRCREDNGLLKDVLATRGEGRVLVVDDGEVVVTFVGVTSSSPVVVR